ncbi:MAG: L,D-transpeptidase family protein [Acidimicrobiia bacterium]
MATAAIALAALPAEADITDIPRPRPPIPGETIANPPFLDLRPGSSGSQVSRLQEALAAAGFFPGEPDGVFGNSTLGAVYAFQKHYGLDRTGVMEADDWRLLTMSVRGPGPGPEPDRVEIDLGRQVLYLIESNEVTGVFPVSSANGESYRNARGRLINANTPEGRFTIQRSRNGWWESYLGFLYRPFYFYGGYAIHGSNSVPPYPASHGCVRVHVDDMDFLAGRIKIGMPVYLYGSDITRDTLIASPPPQPPPAIDGVASV